MEECECLHPSFSSFQLSGSPQQSLATKPFPLLAVSVSFPVLHGFNIGRNQMRHEVRIIGELASVGLSTALSGVAQAR